jgi:uncharacterized membrane protein
MTSSSFSSTPAGRFAIAVIPAVVLLVLDVAWVTANHARYGGLVSTVRCGRRMTVHLGWAVVAYAFVLAAAYAWVVPSAVAASTVTEAMARGAVAGFILYGVFNATNAAMFWPDYTADLSVAVVDTLWGAALFAVVGATARFAAYHDRPSKG